MLATSQTFRSLLFAAISCCIIGGSLLYTRRIEQSQPEESQESNCQYLNTDALTASQSAQISNVSLNLAKPSLIELFEFGELSELLYSDPQSFGEWICSLPEDQEQIALWDRFINKWAAHDFNATLAWAKDLEPSPLQERALLNLSYQWEERDAVELLDFALTLPEGNDRLIVALSTRWAKQNPQEIADWAAQLPDSSRKSKILSSLVAAWAANDPASALDFLSTAPSTPSFAEAQISAVSALSIQSPELASSLLEVFPTGRLRDQAIAHIAYHWTRHDPEGALNWIERSLSGYERDKAAIAGVGATIESEPSASALWANSIESRQLRRSQIERSLQAWRNRDRAAAREWVQSTELPPSWKARFFELIDKS